MATTTGILGYGDFVVTATGSGSGASSATISSFTGTLQPGNTNIIVVPLASTATATVSDSQGNTYSYSTGQNSSGVLSRIGYCINPSVAAGMTVTISGTAVAGIVLFVTGKRDNPTPALDQQNGTSNNGTTLGSTSITPTKNQEFIVASSALGTGTGGSAAPSDLSSSGWTLAWINLASGTHQGIVVYYQVQKVATATSLTFGGTLVHYYGAEIASFNN